MEKGLLPNFTALLKCIAYKMIDLIFFNDMSTSGIILCLEVRESHTLYIYIYNFCVVIP